MGGRRLRRAAARDGHVTGLSLDAFIEGEGRAATSHPAMFSMAILDCIRGILKDHHPAGRVLDPFGGTGKLGLLGPAWQVTSVDIEWEWAMQAHDHEATGVVADALHLPFASGSWPCVATSPPYANRMADAHVPRAPKPSDRTRRSYRLALGREMNPNNAACCQWGDRYRSLATGALAEINRVLEPRGLFVLNVKNHVRDGEVVCVVGWWIMAALMAGFEQVCGRQVRTAGDHNTVRMCKGGGIVVDYETVVALRKRRDLVWDETGSSTEVLDAGIALPDWAE